MIAITGAAGQLGREFQKIFTEQGREFLPLDLEQLDITKIEEIRELLSRNKIELLLNCAAYNFVDKAEEEQDAAYSVNCHAVANMAEECGKRDIKFVTYSTDFVFDGSKNRPYTEDDPTSPLSVYGSSKAHGEVATAEVNPDALIIRTSWVYGLGGKGFAQKIMELARSRARIDVVDDQISAPTYTKDLADATLKLLSNGARGLYHISSGGECSRYDQAKFLIEHAGIRCDVAPISAEKFGQTAKRPKYSKLSSQKAEKELNFQIPDWQIGTIDFLRSLA